MENRHDEYQIERMLIQRILDERIYQRAKWGAAGQGHEVPTWIALIAASAQRAMQCCLTADHAGAMAHVRCILALGIAAAEEHPMPYRGGD